jgi:hypothetical protein
MKLPRWMLAAAMMAVGQVSFAQNNGQGGTQEIKTPPEPVKVETSTTTKPSPNGQPTTDYHPPAKKSLKVKEPPPPSSGK